MKRIFLLTVFFIMQNQMTGIGQEIFVSSTFSHCSYNKFKNNIGYEIAYLYPVKLKSRFGFSFSQSYNNTDYNYIFSSDTDGKNYFRDVEPTNQRLEFSLFYSYDILKSEKSGFFIGPRFGLNYYKIKEFIVERPENEIESYNCKRNYRENNKIGIGLLSEYDRNVTEKISLFISSIPEVIFFSRFGLIGSREPSLIIAINFNFGIKFDLIKKKMN